MDSVPDGATINFRTGTTYLLGGYGIIIDHRSNLTIEGHGTTLKITGCEPRDSAFKLGWDRPSTNITIRDVTVLGDKPRNVREVPSCESSGAVQSSSSVNVVIERMTVKDVWGHCWYAAQRRGGLWTNGFTVRDSYCEDPGVMGIAVTAGRNILVERTTFKDVALYAYDCEPYDAMGGCSGGIFRDNQIDGYGLSKHLTPWAIAFCVGIGTISNLTFTRNTIISAMALPNRYMRTNAGLTICGHGAAHKTNIVITNNVSQVPATIGQGLAMSLANIDGLTVAGNVQVMRVGQLAGISNSTNVNFMP